MVPNVLSIAGSDPSGGAGIQADLKTFSAHNVYGMSVITALTAQNTLGVRDVHVPPVTFLQEQLYSVFDDIDVHAVKIGMVPDVNSIEVIAEVLEEYKPKHIILDPVMVASSGDSLIEPEAVSALKELLIPLASLITPNIPEAEKLMRSAVIDMEVFAPRLLELGCDAALLKGGHLKGEQSPDVLALESGDVETFNGVRVQTENTHGTGCTLSSSIAANLAKGFNMSEAILHSKAYIQGAIEAAVQLSVGDGHGPVYHEYKDGLLT